MCLMWLVAELVLYQVPANDVLETGGVLAASAGPASATAAAAVIPKTASDFNLVKARMSATPHFCRLWHRRSWLTSPIGEPSGCRSGELLSRYRSIREFFPRGLPPGVGAANP